MKRPGWVACALIAGLALPALAQARPLSVEVWTSRGDEAVYDKGDVLKIAARANDDAHLLVYEIDAEGYVNLLFPHGGVSDLIEARSTYKIPADDSDVELVVEGPTGQGYIVAIASTRPFEPMPWFLRPYSAQATALGYEGNPDEEEGVTEEGRIVGDPFVAMERIRRRVMSDHENVEGFATAYTTYYLHEPVKYPRYLCYDCHRPNYWAWWPDFDPYYTSCNAFTFRVNYSWHWGPTYWFGHVPYYVYSCLPGYGWRGRYSYSGWDGWGYWSSIWGGPLRRHKSPPPPGYLPPERYKDGTPPGLIAAHDRPRGGNMTLPIGRNNRPRGDDSRDPNTRIDRGDRGGQRQPAREIRGDEDRKRPSGDRGGIRRQPASERGRGGDVRRGAPRPSPRPQPSGEARRREDGRQPAPQPEPAREQKRDEPAPAPAPDAQPAPKPRDEVRPLPPKGGSRGGERGGRIGSRDQGADRAVPRGRLALERDRRAGSSREPAQAVRRAPARQIAQGSHSRLSAPARAASRKVSAGVSAPARAAKEAVARPAAPEQSRPKATKSERRASGNSQERGARGGR